jgi:hypothetical protein
MPELSESQFAAIGKVADAWATLEFFINQTIWELMNVEQNRPDWRNSLTGCRSAVSGAWRGI